MVVGPMGAATRALPNRIARRTRVTSSERVNRGPEYLG